MEQQDPHLNILLDIQKQLGVLGAETARQSETLNSIDKQAKITNGRVGQLEKVTGNHQSILDNWRGKLAVIVIMAGFVGNLIITWIKKELNI